MTRTVIPMKIGSSCHSPHISVPRRFFGIPNKLNAQTHSERGEQPRFGRPWKCENCKKLGTWQHSPIYCTKRLDQTLAWLLATEAVSLARPQPALRDCLEKTQQCPVSCAGVKLWQLEFSLPPWFFFYNMVLRATLRLRLHPVENLHVVHYRQEQLFWSRAGCHARWARVHLCAPPCPAGTSPLKTVAIVPKYLSPSKP
jgi:hypothetical protein